MPKIKIIEFNGAEHTVTLDEGESLMEGALNHNIPGIDGDCGGSCACGTCHVYVCPDLQKILPEPDSHEAGLLATRPDGDERSRLACQIIASPEMDGSTVSLPEMQM